MIAVFGRSPLGFWSLRLESPPVLPKLGFWDSGSDKRIGLSVGVVTPVRSKGFWSVVAMERLQMACVNEKVNNVGDLGKDGSDLVEKSTNGHVTVSGIFLFLGKFSFVMIFFSDLFGQQEAGGRWKRKGKRKKRIKAYYVMSFGILSIHNWARVMGWLSVSPESIGRKCKICNFYLFLLLPPAFLATKFHRVNGL